MNCSPFFFFNFIFPTCQSKDQKLKAGTYLIQCLPCKHEGPGSNPQYPQKKMGMCAFDPSTGDRTTESSEFVAASLVSLIPELQVQWDLLSKEHRWSVIDRDAQHGPLASKCAHTHTCTPTGGHLCSRAMLSALLMPNPVFLLSKKLEEHSNPPGPKWSLPL